MFIDMKTQCFIEAAKCLNFTKAAEKLYISQPALSKNIAALEQECGMKLFYRDTAKNRVVLTEAGIVMLCELQKVQVTLDGIMDKARRAASGEEGKMTIALLMGQIFNDTVKELLETLAREYPHVEIEKIVGGFRDLRTWLDDGTVDMIVTYEEEARLIRDVMYEEVNEVGLGFVVPRSNPLSKRKKLHVKDLEGEKIIAPDERESYITYDFFREMCHMQGFEPDEIVGMDLNHMNMLAEMGRGIMIAREDTMSTKSPNLKFFKCEELGRVKLVAAWKKSNLNPIITMYHRMYEEIYRRKKAAGEPIERLNMRL